MPRRRSHDDEEYWPNYGASPRPAPGGIKAKNQRGKFVQSWWGTRWIKALTPLMDPGRLSRGRTYARRGQVLEIKIAPGEVRARVQGSRPRPYRVTINLTPLDDAQWARVFDALAAEALYAAQLLNGEMPEDVEGIFFSVQVPLFPTAFVDLESQCSCPDWANPCKHVAAVYYLLGERFDEDPFLLFMLRGRDKDAVAAELRKRRAGAGEVPPSLIYTPDAMEVVDAPPLGACLDEYWGARDALASFPLHIAGPAVEMALLKRLGSLSFLESGHLRAQMERVYGVITACALDLAFSDRESEE